MYNFTDKPICGTSPLVGAVNAVPLYPPLVGAQRVGPVGGVRGGAGVLGVLLQPPAESLLVILNDGGHEANKLDLACPFHISWHIEPVNLGVRAEAPEDGIMGGRFPD